MYRFGTKLVKNIIVLIQTKIIEDGIYPLDGGCIVLVIESNLFRKNISFITNITTRLL